jgi:hypothetical protein
MKQHVSGMKQIDLNHLQQVSDRKCVSRVSLGMKQDHLKIGLCYGASGKSLLNALASAE